MTHRTLLWLSCGLVVAAFLWRIAPSTPAPPTACEDALSTGGRRWLGVASCSTAGCHHDNGVRGTRGSEYTTWVALDPHARAYETLFKQKSRDIVEALYGPETEPAHRRSICLGCHTSNPPEAQRATRFSPLDGVGCESCHGAAEKWRAEHVSWKGTKEREEKEALGMRTLADPVVRFQLCAECHVGCDARDVNHDLIAAGHPRLRFEAALFSERMPRHWEQKDDPDFEARCWALGQVACARASFALLAHRAAGHKPWPEFAAYDCAACHHLPSWREQPSAADRPLGRLQLETWYGDLLPTLVDGEAGADVSRMRRFLESPSPDTAKVTEQANTIVGKLDSWLAAQKTKTYKAAEVRDLLRLLVRDDPSLLTQDQAGQRYLALVALRNSLGRLENGKPDPDCERALHGLGLLAFPQESKQPDSIDLEKFREHLRRMRSGCGW